MKKTNLQQMREEIADLLTTLRLSGFNVELKKQYDIAPIEAKCFEERLLEILREMVNARHTRRLDNLIKRSGMKRNEANARLEDIIYTAARGFNQPLMDQLITCDWMLRENPASVIISGATGVGKTWLAGAFAHEACARGMSVMFVKTSRLFNDLQAARANGTLEKKLQQIAKVKLLVLDDMIMAPMTETNCSDLLDIINDRYRINPTIITSQFPVTSWHELMIKSAAVDGILDRLLHSSYLIEIKGGSMRESVNQ